jgi:2-polyprenyl-3-methyl-5-hydroxy-6-metoxy-1,4-benzoquinol methylase
LVKCGECGFVFVERIPTTDELTRHYSGLYSERQESYEWISPVTSKRFHEWLDFMEPYRKLNRILDVGCGVGHFLSHARDRGWEVHGTEFTDISVDACKKKGIHMKQGPLRSEYYEPESFDIITSLGVIEHINNPCEELPQMRSLLRPGGLLYITTPNFNSVSRDLLGEKWNVISYPGHLCYYTSRTLTRVLHSHGFKKKKMEATGVSITRLRASVDRVDVKAVTASSADEKLRSSLENNKVLYRVKSMVNSLLTITGKGDELKASFVRE